MATAFAEPGLKAPPRVEIQLPAGVTGGTYRVSAPLIRQSRLTSRSKGGVGKQLSDGWCLNFAVRLARSGATISLRPRISTRLSNGLPGRDGPAKRP